MKYMEDYYCNFDEEGRLLSRSGQVEYLTTMKYIKENLANDKSKRILEIGAGTGRYCIELAKQGYQVDAIELVEHNLNILRSKLTGKVHLKCHQGNALDLSRYQDNSFDLTLLLGPLYHLGSAAEKLQALKEAVRVTKHGGFIMAAYCMNDAVIIQEGFMKRNLSLNNCDGMVTENFQCIYKPEDVFSVVRLDEIYDLTVQLPVKRFKLLATDGATHYLRMMIDNMDDETFNKWIKYHFSICERLDFIGATNHSLDILQKND